MTEHIAPDGRSYLIEQTVMYDAYDAVTGHFLGQFESPADAERACDSHAEMAASRVVSIGFGRNEG